MAKLSYHQKKNLPRSMYAFPNEKKEPLVDRSHVSNAISRFHQVSGVTSGERATAKKRINAMRKRFGMPIYNF